MTLRPPGLAALSALLLTACAPVLAPEAFAGRAPEMRPERFFAGETRSQGVLEAPGGAPSQRFTVEGRGAATADGGFTLVQVVRFEGAAPRTRSWRMRAVGPHTYAGALTDATGEVSAEAYGDLLHLRYRLKAAPLGTMEQWLYLQADGRTVMNEAVIQVAGVTVRRLSERISRAGPAEAAAEPGPSTAPTPR